MIDPRAILKEDELIEVCELCGCEMQWDEIGEDHCHECQRYSNGEYEEDYDYE